MPYASPRYGGVSETERRGFSGLGFRSRLSACRILTVRIVEATGAALIEVIFRTPESTDVPCSPQPMYIIRVEYNLTSV